MITIDVASLHSAVENANAVAPVGAAKTPGVVLESDGELMHVMATDVTTTYRQRVYPSSTQPCYWRLPSREVNAFLKQVPVSAVCEMREEDDGQVMLAAGSTTLKIRRIANRLPTIPVIPRASLARAEWFAQALAQVSWAASNESGHVLSGVHFSGDKIIATDKHAMAAHDLECPVEKPITAPLTSVTKALKGSVDVEVGASRNRLLVMPDVDTQITTLIFEDKYPDWRTLYGRVSEMTPSAMTVENKRLNDGISRVNVLADTENIPATQMTADDLTLEMCTLLPDFGEITERVELKERDDDPFQIGFQTAYLRKTASAVKGEDLTINYGRPSDKLAFLRFTSNQSPSWVAFGAGVRISQWQKGSRRAQR